MLSVLANVAASGYRLYTVVPRLLLLIDNLTNWYIRLNRARLKGAEAGVDDTIAALNTLFETLYTLVCALAPFIPFLTDHMFQLLIRYIPQDMKDSLPDIRSVHFQKFPEVRKELFDEDTQRKVHRMQKTIELTRLARERRSIGLKTPLQSLVVIADESFLEDIRSLLVYVKKELNVREVILESDGSKYNVKLGATIADWPKLGKRLKGGAQLVRKALPDLTEAEIKQYLAEDRLMVGTNELQAGDLTITRLLKEGSSNQDWEVNSDVEALILLDATIHEHLRGEAIARDVISRIQKLRKTAGLQAIDDVRMEYSVLENPDEVDFAGALEEQKDMIQEKLHGSLVQKPVDSKQETDAPLAEEKENVSKATCIFRLLKL